MVAKGSERLRVLCVSFAPFALKEFLKPRQVGVGQTAGVDMQSPSSAQRCNWGTLAGVQETVRVEGAFEALLLGEVHLVEHRPHQVAFFDADPMFASEYAADLHAESQDIGAKFLCPLDFTGLVRIVQNQRMQIAVAGMKHIGDAEPVLRRQFADPGQHLGEPAARIVPSMQ